MIIEINEQERSYLRQSITREMWRSKAYGTDKPVRFLRELELKLIRAKVEDGRGFCSKKEVL